MKDMIADALTKPLIKDRHWQLISIMGMETSKHFLSGSIQIAGTATAILK
jgi:hypothetical protein